MKKIIALFGLANSGKSSTLKIVHNELYKLSTSRVNEYHIFGNDLRDIFIINNFRVGIETQGDPGSRLVDSIRFFTKEECKLIICTTRTKGQTVKLVENNSPPYDISWRGQSFVSDAALRDESNIAIASFIIKETKAFIRA